MRTTRRTSVVGTLVLLLTVAAVGAASAYWTGPGAGRGSASSGTINPVTLSPATTSGQIYPGGQASVSVLVTNPNPGLVRVVSLALDTTQGVGGFAVDGAHAACGLGSLSYTTQGNGGSGWSIPGAASSPLTLPGSLAMSTGASDACQGATFTVYLKATL